jgi:GrpB-like predicted nucleotidyltransferase (UPF0157 family)
MKEISVRWANVQASVVEQPGIMSRYLELKGRLADAHRFGREAYTEAKTEFIASVLREPAPAR